MQIIMPKVLDQNVSLPHSIWDAPRQVLRRGWDFSVNMLNKHTDMISSGGILVISTCLLAAKIFENIPPVLPKIATLVYNWGGIIWLNVQVRDLAKSCHDWGRIISQTNWGALVETSVKVFIKAFNILVTCLTFGVSVLATFAFPEATLALQLALRPIALTTLVMNILSDIRDYALNERILDRLEIMEKTSKTAQDIAKTMICFLEITLKPKKPEPQGKQKWPEEWLLADSVVRQLDTWTIETFQENLVKPRTIGHPREEGLKLFYAVKDSMINKQKGTRGNLFLTGLGYVSMGICKAFPGTLLEKSTRWGNSVLYNDELIGSKLYQHDLAQVLAK